MALSNHEKIGKMLQHLRDGLGPWVEQKMSERYLGDAMLQALQLVTNDKILAGKNICDWDLTGLFGLLLGGYQQVFSTFLGQSDRSLIFELKDYRNKWAHQHAFSSNDLYRALDTAERILLSCCAGAPAEEVGRMKSEVLRLTFDEQVRSQKRKTGVGPLISPVLGSTLKPWREVIVPHEDVAKGRFSQAEFAADLWQVFKQEGSEEYANPAEFFRRTFLTTSLRDLLVNAFRRLSGLGGDPVIQLQTNFGGGKTHSMLALYHAVSGVNSGDLLGIDDLLTKAEVNRLPKANRVVLVGNKISPSTPSVKPDGTIVRTLWGELAYQLGGAAAYARLAKDDASGTSPGDILRELFNDYGPCLILVDEWVAYARQLPDHNENLPHPLCGGGFDVQFSFAQALTESAKLAKNCLLLVSLPASDSAGVGSSRVEDIEVGGVRGREALERLRNVVGRVESSWKPASAEEGFEIVRRRLFQPMDVEGFKDRDLTARLFSDMYKAQKQEFPLNSQETDYENRIKSAYPIHPEVFDRLYKEWSTLVKFQRTRGVLRLMATVIHHLWEEGDKNPLIMPSLIPIDDPRIQNELLRYLSDNWQPIIEKDVDGPYSLPTALDAEFPNLGKLHACRRVARTVYLGSAPTSETQNKGIEDRQVKLGCVMPGESPAVFGDALRRLSDKATYLYQDGPRVWYSTQPTVTKVAEDRAESFRRNLDKVVAELESRVRKNLQNRDVFTKLHAFPQNPGDLPDELNTRLVVLGRDHLHSKGGESPAQVRAQEILDSRGSAPRIYRNTLVFLVADQTRYQDLEAALCKYLAWESIVDEKTEMNLTPFQLKQAENQLKQSDLLVEAQIPETFQTVLVPKQLNASAPVTWKAVKCTGIDGLAKRVATKLTRDNDLTVSLSGTALRIDMDKVPLWRGKKHVLVQQLVEDFARYTYLPRLLTTNVLLRAVENGTSSLSWKEETFAYADSCDETTGRYLGLKLGQKIELLELAPAGLIVHPEAANLQTIEPPKPPVPDDLVLPPDDPNGRDGDRVVVIPPIPPIITPPPPIKTLPKRFHGTVHLNPQRAGADAGKIAESVLVHLVNLPGAKLTISFEIQAILPEGASDQIVRIITENCNVLKFQSQGFERE